MKGGKFLQASHPPEAQNGTLLSLELPVRVLGSIVQPTAGFLSISIVEGLHRGTV